MPQQQGSLTGSERYMRAFAASLAACTVQAQAYGQCLSARLPEVEKGCCQQEFQALKQCFVKEVHNSRAEPAQLQQRHQQQLQLQEQAAGTALNKHLAALAMTKFKRQLVPGTYLTAADMLQVLSQQQFRAVAVDGCILLAAEPAVAWLLDSCCVGAAIGETWVPVCCSVEGHSDHMREHGESFMSTIEANTRASAPADLCSRDCTLRSRALHVGAVAGVNRASEHLQQQYQRHQQQVVNRKQRRGRRAAAGATAGPTPAAPAAAHGTAAVVAGIIPPPAAPLSMEAGAADTAGLNAVAACIFKPAAAAVPVAADAAVTAAPVADVVAVRPGGAEACSSGADVAVEGTHSSKQIAAATAAGLVDEATAATALIAGNEMQPEYSIQTEVVQLVQLDLHEAFFLMHVLCCCSVYTAAWIDQQQQDGTAMQQPTADEQAQGKQQGVGSLQQGQQVTVQELSVQQFWHWCCTSAGNRVAFVSQYAAYHHFRSKGWLPRSGLLYGADYVLYQLHPEHAHSDYVVSVIVERAGCEQVLAASAGAEVEARVTAPVVEQETGTSAVQQHDPMVRPPLPGQQQPSHSVDSSVRSGVSWLDAHILQRLARQVLKQLLLLYVVVPDGLCLNSPECVQQLAAREVLVKRWVPAEHRDDGK